MIKKILSMVLMVAVTQFAWAAENLFEKNYKAQSNGNLQSMQANPDTKLYVSNHNDTDNISMLEDGYDMMGSTGFEAGNVPAELALEHAKSIKADAVLVYTKYASQKTGFSKIEAIKEAAKTTGEIDPEDFKDTEEQYNYYASYWIKMRMPLLGLHVIKLKVKEEGAVVEVDGLNVLAVIKESPAAKAKLLRGDTLLKMGDIVLDKPQQLSIAARKYAGKQVGITFVRNGEQSLTQATLNQR